MKLFVVIIVYVFLIILAIGVVFFIYQCLRSPASILSPHIDAAIEMQPDPSILDTFLQTRSRARGMSPSMIRAVYALSDS